MMLHALRLFLLLCPSFCLAGKTLRVCGGQSEWPPSAYYASTDKKTITGYSVDVLHKIFENSGYQIQIQLLPWPRCLAEVQKGGEYQIAMAVSRTPEREARFLFSRPYLFLTPGLVSLKAKQPFHANSQTLTKCGVNGFNYQPYSMFSSAEIDTTANNYESVIRKLSIGRCDFLLEYVEIAQTLVRLEEFGFKKNIYKIEKIIGAKSVPAHFAFGVNSKYSKEVLSIINTKLDQLEKNGQLKNMTNKSTQ
jgi:polar amino acid transport system substrate-binding protein